ncbi:MAG: hypothetical protein V2I54_08990 [Bacteroidales bacterium]|jgi:hypothetical protein|nr:hypothetical protein [Bacteroidales bacterium]
MKHTKNFSLLILGLSMLFACNRQQTSGPEMERMERWLAYYNLSLNHFTDTLTLKKYPEIKTTIDPSDPQDSLFHDLYIYSPEKKRAIDLDSYFLVLEKNREGKLVCHGTEADQEVALIDLIKQERQRIIFCGTACRAEEVQWLNQQEVLIMGFVQPLSQWIPALWFFNTEQESLIQIKGNPLQVNKKPNSYNQAVRLKEISFPEKND